MANECTSTYLNAFRQCPDKRDIPLNVWRTHLWSQALPDSHKSIANDLYEMWLQLRYKYLALTDDAIGTLKALRKTYLLAIITNGPSNAQWEKIDKLNLVQYFDCILVSDDLPWEKPNKHIFLTACKHLAVQPENCIMIGDKLEIDIQGAKNAKLGGTIWIPLNGKPQPIPTMTNDDKHDAIGTDPNNNNNNNTFNKNNGDTTQTRPDSLNARRNDDGGDHHEDDDDDDDDHDDGIGDDDEEDDDIKPDYTIQKICELSSILLMTDDEPIATKLMKMTTGLELMMTTTTTTTNNKKTPSLTVTSTGKIVPNSSSSSIISGIEGVLINSRKNCIKSQNIKPMSLKRCPPYNKQHRLTSLPDLDSGNSNSSDGS